MNRPASSQPARPVVVVVEDDRALGSALKFALEIDGYTVVLMDRAEPLLDVALPPPPVCLVIDQKLPGLSGLDVLLALRARGQDAPAVLMTTGPAEGLRARARQADAVIVEKPILDDRLLRVIHGFWNR